MPSNFTANIPFLSKVWNVRSVAIFWLPSHIWCAEWGNVTRITYLIAAALVFFFFFWLLLRFYGNNLQHSKGNCLTKRPPKKSQKEMWPQASSLRSSIEGLHNPTIHFFLMSLVKATIIRNEKTTGYYSLMLYSFSVPPTIRPDPPDGNYVVKKGRKVELKCVASGNPDPTITWTRQVKNYDLSNQLVWGV